jgi:alkylated DNA repair dioxygenase AlkB
VLALQADLFSALDAPAVFERADLDSSSWVEVARGWLPGADELCWALADGVSWTQRRRRMYDRVVDEPRLTRWYGDGRPLPHPQLYAFRRAMSERYGVTFRALGLNYYRDGRDSVAFHRDRELRYLEDTLVAILTLGARRPFLIHPLGGGRSLDLAPASGDVLVMRGACQLRWEHGVPKVAASGPRISASVRWTASPPPAPSPAPTPGQRRPGRRPPP